MSGLVPAGYGQGVRQCHERLEHAAGCGGNLRNPALCGAVLAALDNPAPTPARDPDHKAMFEALRAMSASRLYGALALWSEVFLLLVPGGLLGLGYALIVCGAHLFAAHTGVLPLIRPTAGTLLTFALTLGTGSLAAVFPAWCCSRTSVAAALRA